MEWFDKFVRGLGEQNSPFGFAPPVSPSQGAVDPAYNAGMQFIGNVGAGMLAASNEKPMTALGKSLMVAQAQSREQNKDQYAANLMMQEADAKKQERARTEEERKRRDDFIAQLPPDQRMKAMSIPGYLEKLVEATDPAFQQPTEAKRYNVGGALVDADGNVIYQGQETGGISADIESRKTAAAQMGLGPDDPAYKSFILTGKMPREDQAPLTATDKKAILDADESVMTNEMVIDQLKSVITPDASGKALNDKAGSGVLAGWQAWSARNDPTGFFDDAKGEATTELSNIVLGQALGSLKSIFGSAPTEGERKILVELQASVDKTPKERKPIIERAIKLAQLRLDFNKRRAEELRGQTYYKPRNNSASNAPDGLTPEEWNAMTPEEQALWR